MRHNPIFHDAFGSRINEYVSIIVGLLIRYMVLDCRSFRASTVYNAPTCLHRLGMLFLSFNKRWIIIIIISQPIGIETWEETE